MRRALLAPLLAAALAGCTSNAERLVELRADLRDRMDALYDRYGGGSLANQARTDARRAEDGEGAATAARVLGEIDRSWFEGYCLAHGRGDRPFNLSEKLEAFMKEPANRDACREAARLDARIRTLEDRAGRR